MRCLRDRRVIDDISVLQGSGTFVSGTHSGQCQTHSILFHIGAHYRRTDRSHCENSPIFDLAFNAE